MDKRSVVIFVASLFIAGASLMQWLPRQVGIVLIIFACVWALLTLPKRGLLRKRWESKAKSERFFSIQIGNDIAFGTPGEHGFAKATGGESLMLRLAVEFRAIPHMRVESVELEVMGRRIPSNWGPTEVGQFYGQYIYLGIPNLVNSGRHNVRLITFAGGKEWHSDEYSIDFPQQ